MERPVVLRGNIIRRADGTHYAKIFFPGQFTVSPAECKVYEETLQIYTVPDDRNKLKGRLEQAAMTKGIQLPLEYIEG